MRAKKLSGNKGMTLIEVLIAVAILGLIIIPLSSLFTLALENTAYSKAHSNDRLRAETYMERIRQTGIADLLSGKLDDRNPASAFFFDNFTFEELSATATYTKENTKITISPYKNSSAGEGVSYVRAVGGMTGTKSYTTYNEFNVENAEKSAMPIIDLRKSNVINTSKAVPLNITSLVSGASGDESKVLIVTKSAAEANLNSPILDKLYFDVAELSNVIRIPVYVDDSSENVTLSITTGIAKRVELILINPDGAKPSFPKLVVSSSDASGQSETPGKVSFRDYTKYFVGHPVINACNSVVSSQSINVKLSSSGNGINLNISGYTGISNTKLDPVSGKLDLMVLVDDASDSVNIKVENNTDFELKLFLVNYNYKANGTRDFTDLKLNPVFPSVEFVSGSTVVIDDVVYWNSEQEQIAVAEGETEIISVYKVDIEISSEKHGRIYLEGLKTLN